jgi:unsaturated rhamnogalacturonyl hydrolase
MVLAAMIAGAVLRAAVGQAGSAPEPNIRLVQGKVVLLDAWFNSQQRTNAAGNKEYYHYKWQDRTDSGFSALGEIFEGFGAKLDTLYTAPTREKLRGAAIYIIVSPDIPVKNPNPNYMTPENAAQIVTWVEQGGVLLMMENDPANADIDHLNLLADRFGLHFNQVLSHHVIRDDFTPGLIAVQPGGPIFHEARTLYMKDTCTLTITPPARSLLQDRGDTMIASVRHGRGTVVAVVDPWLYNEYADGRKKLPADDNYLAAKEFARWLLIQTVRSS